MLGSIKEVSDRPDDDATAVQRLGVAQRRSGHRTAGRGKQRARGQGKRKSS